MDGLMLLRRAQEVGLAVAADGDKLVIRGPRSAEAVARLLIEHKPALLALLAEATDWRARLREALTYWSTSHPAGEAAWFAWGEIENHWHMQHGERVPHWQCAGCREPIGGLKGMMLGDGNRVHLDRLDCLFSFGERWRGEATRALAAVGLRSPDEDDAT
jgi:hypothetical protein